MTFRVGDKAVYPVRGVVNIVGVEERAVGGSSLAFYVLSSLEQGDKVLVPVAGAEARGLRPLTSSAQVEELLAVLQGPQSLDPRDAPSRRARILKERLDRGSATETAAVYRDLHRLRERKALSFGEARMLETARDRLALELSLACGRSLESVMDELHARFTMAA